MTARDLSGNISDRAIGARVFDAETLPNATTKTSEAFKFGQCQAGLELVIYANTNISIADTKQLKFELLYDENDTSESGDYSESIVLYDVTADGAAVTFTAGDVICQCVPETFVGVNCKVKITTTANESTEKVDAFVYRIA
jgi:hypothetical protein